MWKTVIFAAVIAVCIPVMAVYAQTTPPRSYYVWADGDNENNGRSEDQPFKTLQKAVDAAKMGVIKRITVLGKINSGAVIEDAGTDEILITGKPDAAEGEKAEITYDITIRNAKVRFTYVSITSSRWGLELEGKSNNITLGAGALVSYIYVRCEDTTLTMTDDARISGKGIGSTSNAGSYPLRLTMLDNAEISGNTDGGGILYWDNLTLIMSGNARIVNNTTTGSGGGIRANGNLTLTMSDNAEISGNTAKGEGGGIYAGGKLTINGNGGKISGNTAKNGGGVFAAGSEVSMAGKTTITGNKAEFGTGVFVSKSEKCVFTHKGGSITGNEAEYVGGGVYVESGAAYTAQGGTVTGNTAGDGGTDVFRQ
jgi:predicted outer membrane repeat protein